MTEKIKLKRDKVFISEVVKEKHKPNWWLTNKEFINKNNFPDKYYLERLCDHINEFLKDIPIPVLTTFDRHHNRIYFSVGNDSNWFRVDPDISFFDYIKQVKRWLVQFYPQYVVEVEEEADLSEEEVLEKVREGIDLNELAFLKKKIIVKENGCITRIILNQDKFEFIKNKECSIRMTGDLNNILPLSTFLKTLREMKSNSKTNEEVREYIFQNSEEVERISPSDKKIVIDYNPKMMKNFFIIRFMDLKKSPMKKTIAGQYIWGKYEIRFQSESSEHDCIQYVKDRRKEKGIVLEIEND